MKQYSHLSSQERQKIEAWIIAKKTIRWIAQQLQRSPSTISREIKRNKVKKEYNWDKADHKAYQRRWRVQKCTKKIRWYSQLEYLIRNKLKEWRSAEVVSMRLMYEYKISIAWITIRRYIESRFWYDIKEYLLDGKHLRKYKKHKQPKWSRILHRVNIDMRPLHILNPWAIWHYECDFIESLKGDKTVILRLIDRYSRIRIAVKLGDKSAQTVRNALLALIKEYNIQSIVFDNDLSFALHRQLWIDTYFCNPYSSREKWLVEWSNREYRKPRPKKTALKNISQNDLDKYTYYLNNRPMKCLHWKSAHEVNFGININYFPTNCKVLHLTW